MTLSRKTVFCALVGAGVLALCAWAHVRAGLTLPLPWPDEAWMAWQSHAFRQTGSFFAPELNPERPIMAYGGGMGVTLGVFFKLAGFSLEKARWFSWLCVMGAWLATVWTLRRLPAVYLTLPVCGWFFAGTMPTVTGNMVRPESQVLLLVTIGYAFLTARQPLKAIFICGLAVLTHPNALYFLLGAVGYAWATDLRRQLWRPTRGDWAVMAACVAPALLSAGMICRSWGWFYHDFFVQATPYAATPGLRDQWLRFAPWLALYGVLLAGAVRARLASGPWLMLGFAGLVVPLIRGEMWYEIYKGTGFMVLTAGGVAALAEMRNKLAPGARRWRAALWIALAGWLLWFVRLDYIHGFGLGPRNYPQKMTWLGMTPPDPAVPYLTEADRVAVRELALARAGGGSAPVVEFPGAGDSVLYADAFPAGVTVRLRVKTTAPSDVVVFRLSRYLPAWIRERMVVAMSAYGIDPERPDHQRDGTERWYVRPEADRRAPAGGAARAAGEGPGI